MYAHPRKCVRITHTPRWPLTACKLVLSTQRLKQQFPSLNRVHHYQLKLQFSVFLLIISSSFRLVTAKRTSTPSRQCNQFTSLPPEAKTVMNSKVSTTLQSVLICHLPLGLETVAAALVARSVTQRLAINQPFIVGIHSPVQGYGSLYAVYRHCAPGAASVFAQASLH